MTNIPFALTGDEFKEIAALKEIQEFWGSESAREMEQVLKDAYAVKFNFIEGSPGYVGDLYILQGDALGGDIPVIRLIRDKDKRIKLLE